MTTMSEMEKYRIEDAPPSMYYIPNFITREEEQHILSSVRFSQQGIHKRLLLKFH